jgi:DHA1 family bicyclomycin/chloramphenicol resistance-like MFS transporter
MTATSGERRAPLAASLVALALALLLGLQPLTTDLYLPALPMLARDLEAPMSAVQLTMSALILAFGVAQLVWGPVADRFGRRPVLLAGLALYTLAGVAATFAHTIGWLIVARIVQGATLAASVVCARAMVRDLFEPHEGAHVMAQGMSGLGLIAIAGPALGGVLAAAFGWRSALGTVAAVGALVLVFVWRALPETIRERNPRATRVAPLAATAREVLRHPTFVAWSGLVSATYGGLFTILAASSFVYIDVLGLSPSAYGLTMASGSLAYLMGTFVCRRWLVAHGLAGAVKRGGLFTAAGGILATVLAAAGVQTVWAVLVPQWLFAFGHGIHQPCGQTGAVGPFPHAAGVASALAGFTLALVAFGVGLWLGQALDGTTRALAYGLGFWSLVTTALAWTLVQRHALPAVRAAA